MEFLYKRLTVPFTFIIIIIIIIVVVVVVMLSPHDAVTASVVPALM